MIQYIHDPDDVDGGEGLLALVIWRGHAPPDGTAVEFLTSPTEPQQVAVICYPQGHVVPAHVHHEHERRVRRTTEVLVVQDGMLRVTVYSSRGREVQTVELGTGDVIALLSGGHRVEFLWSSTVLEIKQGPYAGSRQADKREL